MKLNIGSSNPKGKYKTEEWINIDTGEPNFKGNVKKIDGCNMPLDWDNKFDEIHAVHVLEHINRNKKEQFVEECFRVLEPKGKCYIEVPNFGIIVGQLKIAIETGDHETEHKLRTSVFGKQRYRGDQHCWGFTTRTLLKIMSDARFKDVEVYSGSCLEHMISTHYKQEPVLLAIGYK